MKNLENLEKEDLIDKDHKRLNAYLDLLDMLYKRVYGLTANGGVVNARNYTLYTYLKYRMHRNLLNGTSKKDKRTSI